MRSKQAAKNVLSTILLQLIIALTGIYIPQLMISTYGSDINGVVSSITQFITYLGLVEAGIGSATMVALYVPLANNDKKAINGVMRASRDFYYRSAAIFAALVVGLAFLYPFFLTEDLDASMVSWMILVLGGSSFIDYVFLGKYRMLLTANQKGYIYTLIQSVATILNSLITIVMIEFKMDILLVKSVATLMYLLRCPVVYYFIKKYYPYLNYKEQPNKDALRQRWSALLHQITGVIVNNTDIVVLTVALKNFAEISVYTVYNLIINSLVSLVESFCNGLSAGFGEVLALNDKELLKKSYSSYEYFYYMIMFIAYTCLGILFIPFIQIYSKNFTDAVYVRPFTAILFTCMALCRGIRTPALTMVIAAGQYKETRNAAVLEAVINIGVSLMLVRKYGINGVLIGTICSYLYRTVDVMIYTSKNIVVNTLKKSIWRLSHNIITMVILMTVFQKLNVTPAGWLEWFLYACIVGVVCVLFYGIENFLLEPVEMKNTLNQVKRVVKRG